MPKFDLMDEKNNKKMKMYNHNNFFLLASHGFRNNFPLISQ